MKKLLITLFSVFSMANVNAATLTADTGWSSFLFDGTGSSWSETFTFTITETSTLTVTDAFLSGDIFEVFSDGTSLGRTSTPTSFDQQTFSNYDAAAADSRWSTGIWAFLAGTYTISGISFDSPFDYGRAALKLDTGVSAVPVPAALFLFAPALLGLLGLRRKAVATA